MYINLSHKFNLFYKAYLSNRAFSLLLFEKEAKILNISASLFLNEKYGG